MHLAGLREGSCFPVWSHTTFYTPEVSPPLETLNLLQVGVGAAGLRLLFLSQVYYHPPTKGIWCLLYDDVVFGVPSSLLIRASQPDCAEVVPEEAAEVCLIQSKWMREVWGQSCLFIFSLFCFNGWFAPPHTHTRLFIVCRPASPSLCFLPFSIPQYGKSLPTNPFTLQLNLYTVHV